MWVHRLNKILAFLAFALRSISCYIRPRFIGSLLFWIWPDFRVYHAVGVSEKTIIGTIFLHSVGVRRSAICALREAILGIHQNSFKQNHFYDLLMSHVHSLTRQKRAFHAYITTNTNLSIAWIVELIVMSLIIWLQTPQLTHLTLAKWPPVRRRRFQMHFLEWKCMNFDLNFIEVCS